MGSPSEHEAKRPGTLLLIVPVCPPAWRSHLAEALAPVLNLPADTILSRFSDDGPSTLASSISVEDVDAIEAVFAGQQLRVEWQDKRQGAFELERRWSLIGSALFALVGVVVFWKAPSTVPRLATIGTVPSASAPSPIRPSWDADGLEASIASVSREARSQSKPGPLTASIVGAHLCETKVHELRCYRLAESCAQAVVWIDHVRANSGTGDFYLGTLQDAVTGGERWSTKWPNAELPTGLCRALVRLRSRAQDVR